MSAPMVFSIRAEYCAGILEGSKRWEFRTRCPRIEPGETALIYESRGRGRIVASFRRGIIIEGTPAAAWNEVTVQGGGHGVSFNGLLDYLDGREKAFAMGLIDVRPLNIELPERMRAPQAWARWKGPWPLGVAS